MFTDCSRFIYLKYHDKMEMVGNDGDLSSDNESFDGSSYAGGRSGSFKESGGHRVTRN